MLHCKCCIKATATKKNKTKQKQKRKKKKKKPAVSNSNLQHVHYEPGSHSVVCADKSLCATHRSKHLWKGEPNCKLEGSVSSKTWGMGWLTANRCTSSEKQDWNWGRGGNTAICQDSTLFIPVSKVMPISVCLHVHLNTEACEIQDILYGLSFSEICFKDSGHCSDQCSDTVVL